MLLATESAYSTPVSNSPLLPLLMLSLATQRHSPDGTDTFYKEYDYIIVGGGSAGSVLASRLSEIPCVSVLLLEAGTKPPILTEVPSLARYFRGSDVDWQYRTVPQKHAAAGYVNRQLNYALGKTIGGGSILNSVVYVRGNRKNYDDWESMGATGWSYNDVFPYFLRLEDNRSPNYLFNGYHASGGPVSVEQPRYQPEVKPVFYEAINELGYEIVDPNGARQTGFYDQQGNMRYNQRCSTAKAYLVPAENRTNLDIVPNAMVTKIIIQDREAQGVQFEFRGKSFRVKARREVIVSAGTVNTPQLLMLSGIGPADELEKLNIPVVADLPVGKNFHNRNGLNYHFVTDLPIQDFGEKLSNDENIAEYIENRSGPLASMDSYFYIAFLKGRQISPAVDFPNNQFYFLEEAVSRLSQTGLRPEVYQQVYGPYENQTLISCYITILQPKSRGTVTLRSNDPYDPPLIDPNYLADPRDVEDFIQGLETCQRIFSTKALRKIGAMPLQTLVPGCEKYARDANKYFQCFTRTMAFTMHHSVGTCKMGNPLDETTVVDPKLRVKNVGRLRVIDASVMPVVTSGNTGIPTIMIAEKASDIIKETIDCFENKPRFL